MTAVFVALIAFGLGLIVIGLILAFMALRVIHLDS